MTAPAEEAPAAVTERLVRIALLVRLLALGITVLDLAFRGPDPWTLLLLVALSVTSFAGLRSARLRLALSRRPLLAVPDVLLVAAVPVLVGGDSPLSLVGVSSALVIGALFPLRIVAPLSLVLVLSDLSRLWPLSDTLVDAVRLPVVLLSVTAMGVAFRRLSDRQAELERRAASALVVEAAARERLRIARDVHDTVAKACQGVALTAAALPAWIERDVTVAARHAADVVSAAREAVASARDLLTSLRLDDPSRPLAEVLQELAARSAAVGSLSVHTDLRPVGSLPPADRHELVWAVSEALNNVIHHAPGAAVTLRLVERAGFVWVFVRDDGPGFGPEREAESVEGGHFGLVGMRERMASLGGHAQFTSAPGAGTRVTLALPTDVTQRPPTHDRRPLTVQPRRPAPGVSPLATGAAR
ncbi:MAG: sensor histidine kinase [Kineosporiaceae bacterium]